VNVLITGANGTIGTALRTHLADDYDYDFAYLDREDDPDADEVDVHVADIADYDAVRPAFEGQEAVVHLAGNPSPGAPWPEILESNVVGTYNVIEAACDAGVESVVFASTNHVVGVYHEEHGDAIHAGEFRETIDHADPVRPDSYYAVSKRLGEHLGRYYVEDRAAPRRFYALRIGWVLPEGYDHPYGPAERGVDEGRYERGSEAYESRVAACRSLWCSRRDIARLVDRCLRDGSVEFDVFSGISAGNRQWLDAEHARAVLGYRPLDDADEWDGPP
jgi:nucleoside-diphosphate-sugar epimerase